MNTIPNQQTMIDRFEEYVKAISLEENPQDFPSKVLKTRKDVKGSFHNNNGPAVITEDGVYFCEHGYDWTDEQYEKFIRTKIKQMKTGLNLKGIPPTQLASIVHTSENWGERKQLPHKKWPDLDTDFNQKAGRDFLKQQNHRNQK